MTSGVSLFVLAHPDDEVLFWPLIARRSSEKLAVLYLTDGSAGGMFRPEVRANETRGMLAALGVDPSVARFLGQEHNLLDGTLHTQIDAAWTAITAWADTAGPISRIYTHAWEGGHQDHDVCHALSLALGRKVSADRVEQVACYRRPDSGIAPYSLLDPIKANGALESVTMSGAERRAMAGCILRYPSQWKSWVGLGPPLLTRIAVTARFPLQPTSQARLTERPHPRKLLYEARGGPPFVMVQKAVSRF